MVTTSIQRRLSALRCPAKIESPAAVGDLQSQQQPRLSSPLVPSEALEVPTEATAPHRTSFQSAATSESPDADHGSRIKRALSTAARRASFNQKGRDVDYLQATSPDTQRTSFQSTSHSSFQHVMADEQLDEDRNAHYLTVQIDPSPNMDGVYRAGEPITGIVSLPSFDKEERKLIELEASLIGAVEYHVPVVSSVYLETDSAAPLRHHQQLRKEVFLERRTCLVAHDDPIVADVESDSSDTGGKLLRLPFCFLIPPHLPATRYDEYSPDELARPLRQRLRSRLPVPIPPSMETSSATEATSRDAKPKRWSLPAGASMGGSFPGRTNAANKSSIARVEYRIEILVKRQRYRWANSPKGFTKKESLSSIVCIHPKAPTSSTVPLAIPALLNPARAGRPASLYVDADRTAMRPGPSSPRTSQQQKRVSLQVGGDGDGSRPNLVVGSPCLSPALDPTRQRLTPPVSDGVSQGVHLVPDSEQPGQVQALRRYRVCDGMGRSVVELNFPAHACVTTGRKVPFILTLFLRGGAQLVPEAQSEDEQPVRMQLLRFLRVKTPTGTVKIEDGREIHTPQGQSALRLVDVQRDGPHPAASTSSSPDEGEDAAPVVTWNGWFVVETTSGPAAVSDSKASRNHQDRTLPSFAFRHMKLSYHLRMQVDVMMPGQDDVDDDAFHVVHRRQSPQLVRRTLDLTVTDVLVASHNKSGEEDGIAPATDHGEDDDGRVGVRPPPPPSARRSGQNSRQGPDGDPVASSQAGATDAPMSPRLSRGAREAGASGSRLLPTYSSLFLRAKFLPGSSASRTGEAGSRDRDTVARRHRAGTDATTAASSSDAAMTQGTLRAGDAPRETVASPGIVVTTSSGDTHRIFTRGRFHRRPPLVRQRKLSPGDCTLGEEAAVAVASSSSPASSARQQQREVLQAGPV
ncbi:unnamed protein product [Parajaminaea phylloscopi]